MWESATACQSARGCGNSLCARDACATTQAVSHAVQRSTTLSTGAVHCSRSLPRSRRTFRQDQPLAVGTSLLLSSGTFESPMHDAGRHPGFGEASTLPSSLQGARCWPGISSRTPTMRSIGGPASCWTPTPTARSTARRPGCGTASASLAIATAACVSSSEPERASAHAP